MINLLEGIYEKIILTLYAQHIEFDTDEQKTDDQQLREFHFYSNKSIKDETEKLFNELMMIKNDLITYELNEDDINVNINIVLLYPYFGGKKEINFPSKIFTTIDDFVEKNKSHEEPIKEISSFDEVEEGEGLLIAINNHSSIDTDDFIEELKKKNIIFEIINTKTIRIETGSGDLYNEVILYIHNIVACGVLQGAAWDMTKWALKTLVPNTSKITNSQLPKTMALNNIKRLKKTISSMVNIKPKNLILINFYNNNTETIFEFKSNSLLITVICNKNGEISHFNVEER